MWAALAGNAAGSVTCSTKAVMLVSPTPKTSRSQIEPVTMMV